MDRTVSMGVMVLMAFVTLMGSCGRTDKFDKFA